MKMLFAKKIPEIQETNKNLLWINLNQKGIRNLQSLQCKSYWMLMMLKLKILIVNRGLCTNGAQPLNFPSNKIKINFRSRGAAFRSIVLSISTKYLCIELLCTWHSIAQ